MFTGQKMFVLMSPTSSLSVYFWYTLYYSISTRWMGNRAIETGWMRSETFYEYISNVPSKSRHNIFHFFILGGTWTLQLSNLCKRLPSLLVAKHNTHTSADECSCLLANKSRMEACCNQLEKGSSDIFFS